MKKFPALMLALIMTLCMLSGCKDPIPKKDFDGFNETALNYATRSLALNELVEKYFWVEDNKTAFHYFPNREDGGKLDPAFAWPYTEMVAANWRMHTLTQVNDKLNKFYLGSLKGFQQYLASRVDGMYAYCATRGMGEGEASGDTYYDDNVWISRELLNAYEQLGDEDYLTKSKGVAEFIWSGWANDDLGGIYWLEQNKASRNACSNAPAAILFGRLYQQTKEQKWLDRAKQTYDFCVDNLRDTDGVYFDSIANDGTLNDSQGWKFTYNTGSMISAGVKLFEITKEQKYLDDAKASSEGSFKFFFGTKDGRDYPIMKSANSWFNLLLLDGYVELYHHYPEVVLPFIEAYEANLNYAYANHLSPHGFMANNWVDGFGGGDFSVSILDMSANAENFGLLAHFYQDIKGK